MKTYLDCVPCIIRQIINTLGISGCSDEIGRKVTLELIKKLENIDYSRTPAANSDIAYIVFRDITGIKDPYYELKRRYNRLALEIYPELEKAVESAEDRLYMALKVAVIGNVIDLGINTEEASAIDFNKIIEDLSKIYFSVNVYDEFKESLKDSTNILYLADNAGEIVFDKILIKELVRLNKKVVLSVKSNPIINDATMEDAVEVNFNGLARVIETGNGCIGINMDRSSATFLEEFKKADLIIGKGHGNFETLNNNRANIFFLLKAKCDNVANELGVRCSDIVFTRSKK